MITELDLLMRALASRTRLRILALVHQAPEALDATPGLQPSELARRLGIAAPTVSRHLRILLHARLVRFWKRDRRKYYRLARLHSSNRRSGVMTRVLDALPRSLPPVFPEGQATRPARMRSRPKPFRHGEAVTKALDRPWALLTSLSHFRRILIVRHLMSERRATAIDLAGIADVRPATVRYHLDKLVRRGAVTRVGAGFSLVSSAPLPLRGLLRPLLRLPPGR